MREEDSSRELFKLIVRANFLIGSYEDAAEDRNSVAFRLVEFGEATRDPAMFDITHKMAIIFGGMADQDDIYSQELYGYRLLLKDIRNTETSVRPAMEYKRKAMKDLQKAIIEDDNGPNIEALEHEFVRAEALALVAEAHLHNVVSNFSRR